jgi:hypothetical protein
MAALAIFLMFAAQNTGNNLLYLMSSCFLAILSVGIVVAYRNLSSLSLELKGRETGFVGEQIHLNCHLTPTLDRFHCLLGFGNEAVEKLAPGETVILKRKFTPKSRGAYRVTGLEVYSFFPLGLYRSCLLLPNFCGWAAPVPSDYSHRLEERFKGLNSDRSYEGREGDYWMQKPYGYGEDASLINWQMSARSDKEWVLLKNIPTGCPEKVRFSFEGLDKEKFEASLGIISRWIVDNLKNSSRIYIWAPNDNGEFLWQDIASNSKSVFKWLAMVEIDDKMPEPEGDFLDFNFAREGLA